ncbi:Peptidase M16, C-terminal domain protein [Kalmanozyma brasiliensis GHG001]|uniref:Putative Zn2+-dependent endopeptidase n=1 Tax=Kalmanozyma brasiliensis (strain GHG001) TaxID=1365824 RepID=V5EIT2_KALBG|nr:Peptidase M16, C-terminal domain protein [Kalmanozyma brasiliensis GHG001]EST04590.1 Peptidase M16, C-terminal domain protein [Kalmanozyma brasiliensis GHG001]
MPADGSASTALPNGLPSSHGNFDLVTRHDLDYAPGMSVEKWKSRKTGLTVLWANFDSPLLNCYMTLASEIFEDSGVPHTLEHLIFLGSDLYPYKGVLDTLANRAFASGTNAWTANDHTAYTLTTAGSDGFLRMLPVYLDHVFFPTLTKEGFVTEVYHVDGKGHDAGVVFSEMQGRENSPADLMELKSQRMLYPASSAYRSETGGLMSALRVLDIEKIRDYHHQYYAPHNAALVVCGPLGRSELLNALAPVEERLVTKRNAQPEGPRGWKRPFVETDSALPPTIDGSKTEQPGLDPADPPAQGSKPESKRRRAFVDFPEKDESVGEIQVSWVGPKFQDWMSSEAVNILSTYLTDSPVSAIQKAFVERDDPLCTDAYFGSTDKAGATLLSAYFSSVPSDQLDRLDQQLIDLLAGIVKEGIDMDRMQMVIKRDKLKVLSQLETKPADSFADLLITDFLYGNLSGQDLHKALQDMKRYDELLTWTSDQWTELLQKYFVDNPRLVVVGRPSSALSDKLKADTKALEEERRQKLGEDGLKKLDEQLEAAKKENDRPIPDEMLKQFQIPSTDSIKWIPVGTAQVLPTASDKPSKSETSAYGLTVQTIADELDSKVQAHVDSDPAELPYFIQFDHVNSAFVSISLVFATTDLPNELRAQMQLYLSVLFSLPLIKQDGTSTRLTYEQVVKGLDVDTLEYDVSLGSGGFGELVCAELKLERANYAKGIAWLRDLFLGTQFDLDRLRVTVSKIIQSLPEQKRKGRAIASALSRSLTLDADRSTNLANSVLELVKTMPELQERLSTEPDKVVADFERIRSTLVRPENLRVSVAGDILALEQPKTAWAEHFTQSSWTAKQTLPVPWSRDLLTPLGKNPSRKGLITALPTVESSYSYFSTRGIPSYTHPDAPALVTTITILNAMESFLWRFIRGAGLAYGASIVSNPESQLIHFSLYRSPDSAKAFVEARKVIRALCSLPSDGEELVLDIDETTLESAKSSLHFNIAEAEGTVAGAAQESFFDQVLKNAPKNRGKLLLKAVQKVTVEDVKESLRRYILPLFDAETSVAAVVAPVGKVEEMEKALEAVGYEMERREIDLGKDDESESGSEGEESGSDEEESGSESESESDEGKRG